jgi:hypothetical protein
VAEDTAAARDRVLAARSELGEQLTVLEASGRAAVDIPARLKRSPAKVAAVVGGVGFLAVKGPQRVYRLTRRVVVGKPAPLPTSMLPDEVEKTLRKMGRDGDKVRGALERDFADYAKQARKGRDSVKTLLLLAVARPLLGRAAKSAGEMLFTPDARGLDERLAVVRARLGEATGAVLGQPPTPSEPVIGPPPVATAGTPSAASRTEPGTADR